MAEEKAHSPLEAAQLCSRQILGVPAAVPPAVWHNRHLHGLCQREVCTHCTRIVTDLGVPPSACPGFQRWGGVLYTLCHGSVPCMSTFGGLRLPSNVADESLICDTDLLSSQASCCWHQAEVKNTAAQFSANNPFPCRVLFGSGCSLCT